MGEALATVLADGSVRREGDDAVWRTKAHVLVAAPLMRVALPACRAVGDQQVAEQGPRGRAGGGGVQVGGHLSNPACPACMPGVAQGGPAEPPPLLPASPPGSRAGRWQRAPPALASPALAAVMRRLPPNRAC